MPPVKSPKAARLYYQGMNYAEGAMKSKRVKSILNAMAATNSATALSRLETELENELSKSKDQLEKQE